MYRGEAKAENMPLKSAKQTGPNEKENQPATTKNPLTKMDVATLRKHLVRQAKAIAIPRAMAKAEAKAKRKAEGEARAEAIAKAEAEAKPEVGAKSKSTAKAQKPKPKKNLLANPIKDFKKKLEAGEPKPSWKVEVEAKFKRKAAAKAKMETVFQGRACDI